jgi:hypothetical protein
MLELFENYFFLLSRYSPNLGLGLPPWNSPFHFDYLDLRHSLGLLGRVISSTQGLYLYTNTEKRTHTHKHQTSMPWVGDSNIWSRASEDSACLRPLGYRDRLWKLYCSQRRPKETISILHNVCSRLFLHSHCFAAWITQAQLRSL